MTRRLSERHARRAISTWLTEHYGFAPEYTVMKDGEDGWAWFINPEDTTSYVHADGTIEWYGSSFDGRKAVTP